MTAHTRLLTPGTVSPERGVPRNIARPEYVGRADADEGRGNNFYSPEEVEIELRLHDAELAERASQFDVLAGLMLLVDQRSWQMELLQTKLRTENCPVSGHSTMRNYLSDQSRDLLRLQDHRLATDRDRCVPPERAAEKAKEKRDE